MDRYRNLKSLMHVACVMLLAYVAISCLYGCAGLSATETTGAVGAGVVATGTFLSGLVDVMAPFMPPEKVAELQTIVHSSQDVVTNLAKVTTTYAQAIGDIRAKIPTSGEVALTAGGIDAGIEALRRTPNLLATVLGKAT